MILLKRSLSSELGICADLSNQISSFDGALIESKYFFDISEGTSLSYLPNMRKTGIGISGRLLNRFTLSSCGHSNRIEPKMPRKKLTRSVRLYSRENSRLATTEPSAPLRLAWTSPPKRPISSLSDCLLSPITLVRWGADLYKSFDCSLIFVFSGLVKRPLIGSCLSLFHVGNLTDPNTAMVELWILRTSQALREGIRQWDCQRLRIFPGPTDHFLRCAHFPGWQYFLLNQLFP
jgi:hypothetical protein